MFKNRKVDKFMVYLSNKTLKIILRGIEFELYSVGNWSLLKLFEKTSEMTNLYFSKNNELIVCKVNWISKRIMGEMTSCPQYLFSLSFISERTPEY